MQHNFDKNKEDKNKSSAPIPTAAPQERTFKDWVKKIGFKIWLVVMIIGGTLALIASFFLV